MNKILENSVETESWSDLYYTTLPFDSQPDVFVSYPSNILLWLIMMPLIGIGCLLLVPEERTETLRVVGLSASLLTFLISLGLWAYFDSSTSSFQFAYYVDWNPSLNMAPALGVDGISLFFILLTTFLVPLCLLSSWKSIGKQVKEFLIAFLLLESCLCVVFSVLDLLVFYIFFESVLLPMFFIIGVWGSRTRKIRAAYQFFLYTLLGSVFMLVAILCIAFETGTTDLQCLLSMNQFGAPWSEERQLLLWLAFFASFAVKVPMVPFHIWLPEAHVEAPTAGSVILAGILLKLGTYGFLRFSLPLFPEASLYFTPLIYTMSAVAIVYTSLTTLRQIDLKKIIAYSSVAHMGFVTIGLFTGNLQGIEGAILIMLSHGFVSSALFLCVGVLYDRHHTRILKYYSGLAQTMPLFAVVFVFFTLANLGFPGTSSFSGELLTLVGMVQSSVSVTVIASTGMVLGAAYSVWLCNRLLFGGSTPRKLAEIWETTDLTKREMAVFFPLIFLTLWMGIFPSVFLDPMHVSVANLVYGL
jgi:proton-translocating NADH-quinone oxidoreductase chain M